MKNLILGYGILGKELVNQTGWEFLSRSKNSKFNFNDPDSYSYLISDYDCIINCVANTDTYSHDKKSHWNLNYDSVSKLVDLCNLNNQKLIHISTDYIYTNSNENASENDIPVHNKTWYGYTKLLGDAHVQLKSNNYLLIRCGHKVTPFQYDKAFSNVTGNFDYVDKIASLIVKLIRNNAKGIVNVGTERKTMYDLALKTNANVNEDLSDNDLMPNNITMNLKKMESNI